MLPDAKTHNTETQAHMQPLTHVKIMLLNYVQTIVVWLKQERHQATKPTRNQVCFENSHLFQTAHYQLDKTLTCFVLEAWWFFFTQSWNEISLKFVTCKKSHKMMQSNQTHAAQIQHKMGRTAPSDWTFKWRKGRGEQESPTWEGGHYHIISLIIIWQAVHNSKGPIFDQFSESFQRNLRISLVYSLWPKLSVLTSSKQHGPCRGKRQISQKCTKGIRILSVLLWHHKGLVASVSCSRFNPY